MTSTLALRKFDPAEHPGNVYESFIEFIESFEYEYEAIAKQPPAGTTDIPGWTALDKRKQFLGRYASRNLQKDYEDETTTAERTTMTFDDTVNKLKARYKPTQNTTLLNYEFHRLHQEDLETFDTFVNRVKHEASNCNFKCNDACTIPKILIRDQIIVGTTDNEIRKKALSEQWDLDTLVGNGRKMEAAAFGADKIKKEVTEDGAVSRVKPGKYSRKNAKKPRCKNCSNPACLGGKKCCAYEKDCFDCGGAGHFKGAPNCSKEGKRQKKAKQPKKPDKARRVKDDSTSSESSSGDTDAESTSVKRVVGKKEINAANIVAHVRRSKRRSTQVKRSRYLVPVVIKEQLVDVFADTGADISVISKKLASSLGLPLVKTDMRIKPYGLKKRIKCTGYYVGPVMYDGTIANLGIYVVNRDVEPLLSGYASEALGIITFNGSQVRRSEANEAGSLEVEDPETKVIIDKHPDIFTGVGTFPDYTSKYYIDEKIPPVACPNRPPPYHLQPLLDKEMDNLEQEGIVEDHEGPAPWISNLVLAPRDDGGIRVTVDMREPNKAILSPGLPIPRAEDIRKEFVGCTVFSKLDFKTAFFQIKLDEKSRYLTVFQHKNKLKRFTRLTMGAKPASGELNKALRPIFSKIKGVHIIHDDLVIATETEEEHDRAIKEVVEAIKSAGLTLNPHKCLFKKDAIPFWGMIISKHGVRPDPKKVQALKEASHPETKDELMSFLCMIQASSEFIPGLAQMTANLREQTKKNKKFKWTRKCNEEFEHLKTLLCEEALLTYFDPDLPTFLLVDAHRSGISAILAQGTSADTAKMVTCASRATTPVEQHYAQLDLEALAIDFALRRFRQYIVGDPKVTVVITDHKPLVSIFKSTRRGSIRTDRIKLRHQDINYEVVYKAGKNNRADFMSRHATKLKNVPKEWKEEARELEKTVWFLNLSPYSEAVSLPHIVQETKKDKKLSKVIKHVKQGYIPKKDKTELQQFTKVWDSLTVSDTGLLLKGEKIVLPQSLWQRAIDKAHQGGHPGITRMKSRIRNHFWIPTLNALVEQKVSNCETCLLYTAKTTKEPIAPQRTTNTVWEEVSIDLFGPLPDKKHVLVVQDTLSRFPAATIVPNTSAQPVIKALNDTYTAYGQPERHRTDNGPPFNSEQFRAFSNSKGIEHVKCYPHHPQGNPSETFMKPLGKALKAAYYNRDSAQEALDELLRAYRSTPHPATKTPPGDLLFREGYKVDFPRRSTDTDLQAAQINDKEQKKERKEKVNSSKKRTPMKVEVGDQVILKSYPKGKKFQPIYGEEVYEVIEVEDKGVVVKSNSNQVLRRHKDDIKLFKSKNQVVIDEEESDGENPPGEEHEDEHMPPLPPPPPPPPTPEATQPADDPPPSVPSAPGDYQSVSQTLY